MFMIKNWKLYISIIARKNLNIFKIAARLLISNISKYMIKLLNLNCSSLKKKKNEIPFWQNPVFL